MKKVLPDNRSPSSTSPWPKGVQSQVREDPRKGSLQGAVPGEHSREGEGEDWIQRKSQPRASTPS